MPAISRFHGIVISMYHNDHPPSHFHARYAGHKAEVSIERVEELAGSLPPRQRAQVVTWAKAHQEELRENWTLARQQLPLKEIEPLE